MSYERDAAIGSYEHERRPRADEALHTLRKVASMVKPIMRSRGWRVGVLTEFYPSQQNLLGLNVNRGQKICLRLRYPTDERQFLPIENVIDTMLHELAHIVYGPHDQHFHALWDKLREEYEALLRKGYTGEGFLSQGRTLGGPGITLQEARRQARAAAERRKRAATRSRGSGQKVGGRPVGWGQDIREVIAGAADRRRAIMSGCGSSISSSETDSVVHEASRNGFRTKAEEDEANDRAIMQAYMELVQEDEKERLGAAYEPATAKNPAGSMSENPFAMLMQAGQASSQPPPAIPMHTKPRSAQASSSSTASQKSEHDGWACRVCTLFNLPDHLICDACGVERPSLEIETSSDAPSGRSQSSSNKRPASASTGQANRPVTKTLRADGYRTLKPRSKKETIDKIYAAADAQRQKPVGWLCMQCGNFMETEWWTCAQCGRMKDASS